MSIHKILATPFMALFLVTNVALAQEEFSENSSEGMAMTQQFENELRFERDENAKNFDRLSKIEKANLFDSSGIGLLLHLRLHASQTLEVEELVFSVDGKKLAAVTLPAVGAGSDYQWHSFRLEHVPPGLRFLDVKLDTRVRGLITPLAEFPVRQILQSTIQLTFDASEHEVRLLADVVDEGTIHPDLRLKLKNATPGPIKL